MVVLFEAQYPSFVEGHFVTTIHQRIVLSIAGYSSVVYCMHESRRKMSLVRVLLRNSEACYANEISR